MQNTEGVGLAIEQALQGRPTLPTPTRLPPPSPQGGGAISDRPTLVAPSSPSPLRGGSDEPSCKGPVDLCGEERPKSYARRAMGGGREDGIIGASQHAFRKGGE